MALEAIVYPQDPFSYISCKNFPFHDLYFQQEEDRDPQDTKNNIKLGQELEQEQRLASINYDGNKSGESDVYIYNEEDLQWPRDDLLYGSAVDTENQPPPSDVATGGGRRKRRRMRSSKNKEEIENQRMTHIAVERNRRKQMNEYLAVLRSLMPPSYAQRGDQASIVGGAINYLKELEQHLQSMEPPVKTTDVAEEAGAAAGDSTNIIAASSLGPFSDFFAFPQYSSRPSSSSVAEGTAEIEVTMVESHASVKILAKKRPRQLLKLVASIQSLRLTLLHLNVTTRDNSVLYSISLKVEEGSQLNTVEDIAAAMNQILRRIEEESSS
ncbi:hypothetical protein EUTSA_v10018867mg [Eutrema salsugineum]|uniref:BHLH domain-containing protein n=1 Tax=Eutrema salsugineum TaxID=72664 RepID=V4KDW8_EUTSA|nr:transcription factor bHLH96 [Eutrema salsugineum]ESQ27972.1 hypothetical protein EUTSA_v10018867mg [Eutrema salsugineum]